MVVSGDSATYGLAARGGLRRGGALVEDGRDGVALRGGFSLDLIANRLRTLEHGGIGLGLLDPCLDGQTDLVGDGESA